MFLNSIYAFIGTLSFCIIFNIKGRNLFFTSLGGGLSWFFYTYFTALGLSEITSLFLSSLILASYSEIMARLFKSPVTTFVICALIPLVPGSGMYYTMLASIQGNINKSLTLGLNTLSSAGALALGIVLISSLSRLINSAKGKKLKV